MALDAVRLAFEGGREQCDTRQKIVWYATLHPSPRLQRLGPDRAVFDDPPNGSGPGTSSLTCHVKLPLMWFSKDRPSAVSPACVLSRAAARKPPRFDPPLPSVGFLPPLPFPTTLTGCSACRPTGLFRPVSGPGVQVVLLPASPLLCRHINRSSGRSSHLPSYPPKCSPRGWPPCVTASRFPLAVAPFHRFQRSRARPQGFAPSTSPLSVPALPPCPTRYSLGLWSSSRFSLHPECSSEHPRNATAVAVLF